MELKKNIARLMAFCIFITTCLCNITPAFAADTMSLSVTNDAITTLAGSSADFTVNLSEISVTDPTGTFTARIEGSAMVLSGTFERDTTTTGHVDFTMPPAWNDVANNGSFLYITYTAGAGDTYASISNQPVCQIYPVEIASLSIQPLSKYSPGYDYNLIVTTSTRGALPEKYDASIFNQVEWTLTGNTQADTKLILPFSNAQKFHISLNEPVGTELVATVTSKIDPSVSDTITMKVSSRYETTAYNVTFYTPNTEGTGWTRYKNYSVEANTKLTETVPDPTITDYTFDNWYLNTSFTTLYDKDANVNGDTQVYAKFTENATYYTVAFNTHGGTEVASQRVKSGYPITSVTTTRDGYTFNGWYKDSAYTQPYTTTAPVTSSFTLHAKWTEIPQYYTVTFNTYDDDTTYTPQRVLKNDKATNPGSPIRVGYEFVNWVSDDSKLTAQGVATTGDIPIYNFETPITDDTVLYAAYNDRTSQHYSVTFNTNGGTTVATIVAGYNESISEPEDPTRTDYTFLGWYTDSTLKNEYDFSSLIRGDIQLYAKWAATTTVDDCTVTFRANDTTHATQTVAFDDPIDFTAVTNPTKTGYTFTGWCSDSNGTTLFDEDTPIVTDTTLYASWKPNNTADYYLVKFENTGDTTIVDQYVHNGEYATKPADPTRDGYLFKDWLVNESAYDFTSPITRATTITADWEEIIVPETYTVTFYIDDTEYTTETIDKGNLAYPPTLPVHEGTFICWCTDTALESEFNFATVISSNKDLYAKYDTSVASTDIIITLNANGGKLYTPPTSVINYNDDGSFKSFKNMNFLSSTGMDTISIEVPAGKTWTEVFNSNLVIAIKDDLANKTWSSSATSDVAPVYTSTQKVYAHYADSTTSTITLNANYDGGSNQTLTHDPNAVVTLPTMTRTNHVLRGYASSATATDAEYLPDTKWICKYLPDTLYAVWSTKETRDSYFLIYHLGYPANSDQQKVEYLLDATTEDNVDPYVVEGYEFAGWYTDKSYKNAFTFGETLTDDVDLYPKYNPHADVTYTLHANPKDHTTWTSTDSDYTEGKIFTLPEEMLDQTYQATDYNFLSDPTTGELTLSLTVPYNTKLTLGTLVPKTELLFFDQHTTSSFDVYDSTATQVKADASEHYLTEDNANIYVNWEESTDTVTTTFDPGVGSTDTTSITKKSPALFEFPDATPEDGYAFLGWAVDPDETDDNLIHKAGTTWINTMDGTDYTAIYIKDEGDVTAVNVFFNSMGGTYVKTKKVYLGTHIKQPEDPSYYGYNLLGWYQEESLENIWNFSTDIVTGEMTLYAKWDDTLPHYTITFNSNGGSVVSDIEVRKGETATKPTNPTRDGYTFVGWYIDNLYMEAFDWETPIDKDYELYAKWTESGGEDDPTTTKYTVRFYSKGGTAVTPQTVVSGNKAIKPTNPTRTGYTFKGWYTSDTYETEYKFTEAVNSDVSLYAKWEEVETYYTVTFNSRGGSAVPAQIVAKGDVVKEPTAPTKSNHQFLGWYSNIQLTRSYNFKEPVTADLTLYASWKDLTPKISIFFDTDGGTAVRTQQIPVGTTAYIPTPPTKDGYYFVGWYEDTWFTTPFDFDKKLTEDTVIYAKWTDKKPLYLDPDIIYYYGTIDDDLASHINVYLDNNKLNEPIRVETDADGFYIFSNLKPGIYNVTYTINGVHTYHLVHINETIEQNFAGEKKYSSDVITNNKSMMGAVDAEAEINGENTTGTVQYVETLIGEPQQAAIIDVTDYDTVNDFYSIHTMNGDVQDDETQSIMEVVIPYTFVGKSNFKMYRNANGNITTLSEVTTEPDELTNDTFYVDRYRKYLHIYTNTFGLFSFNMVDDYRTPDKIRDKTTSSNYIYYIADITNDKGDTEQVVAVWDTSVEQPTYNGRKHIAIGSKSKKNTSADVPVTISNNFIESNNIKVTLKFRNNKNAYTTDFLSLSNKLKSAPNFTVTLKAPKGASKAVKKAVKKANKILKKKDSRVPFVILQDDISNIDETHMTTVKLRKGKVKSVSRKINGKKQNLKKTEYQWSTSGNTITIFALPTKAEAVSNYTGYIDITQ